MGKKKEPLIYKGSCGGRNRTRTCDPIDVNDVLYQLSHATVYVIRFLGFAARVTSTGAHRIGGAIWPLKTVSQAASIKKLKEENMRCLSTAKNILSYFQMLVKA